MTLQRKMRIIAVTDPVLHVVSLIFFSMAYVAYSLTHE